jgi:hypothetical protein
MKMRRDELGFADYDWYAPRVFAGLILLYFGSHIYSAIKDTITDNKFKKATPIVYTIDSTYNTQKRLLEKALHVLDSTHTAKIDSLRKVYDLENKVRGK